MTTPATTQISAALASRSLSQIRINITSNYHYDCDAVLDHLTVVDGEQYEAAESLTETVQDAISGAFGVPVEINVAGPQYSGDMTGYTTEFLAADGLPVDENDRDTYRSQLNDLIKNNYGTDLADHVMLLTEEHEVNINGAEITVSTPVGETPTVSDAFEELGTRDRINAYEALDRWVADQVSELFDAADDEYRDLVTKGITDEDAALGLFGLTPDYAYSGESGCSEWGETVQRHLIEALREELEGCRDQIAEYDAENAEDEDDSDDV